VWFVGDGQKARYFSAQQRMTRLALNGQFIRAQVCPLSDKSGQTVDFGGGWFVR